jgi:prepilin-type N-terminal cleavage/methylation domain-containing protein
MRTVAQTSVVKLSVRPTVHGGFSLLELAIVLLITGILMGALLKPFGSHLLERQRSETQAHLKQIQSAVLGFAAANSRLPCPLVDSSEPLGDCGQQHGFVPGALLGVDGRVNSDGLLVDAWRRPIRYSVSAGDSDGDGNPDFTEAFGMQRAGMAKLAPDYEVCDAAARCPTLRANQVPVVIYSTGPNPHPRSADEKENLDGDTRFVMRDPDTAGNDQFDDLVTWVSENALYTHLIRAGVLP